jgi:formylglycine-generating enzyme required for sulfatase activity
LPDYYLAKTPVTNVQYTAFVRATGYVQPSYWKGRRPPRGKKDHPVVYVSWDDAMKYCQWLSEVTGRNYDLPSEAEWEKGARGTDGRIYPWGNQWDAARCNSGESGLEETTSVYAYPQGASPYGILDMAGNMFEWTRSLWGRSLEKPDYRYPYKPTDGRENLIGGSLLYRVVRGRGYGYPHECMRCAFRSGYPALALFSPKDCGFRVVMHP